MIVQPPDLGPTIEPLAAVDLASGCDPTPKPGALMLRDFVTSHFGGGDLGIGRECGDKPNEHTEGRAWDWALSANNLDDVARAESLFNWLFATDTYGSELAMWRRAGLMYLIWNGRIFSNRYKEWRPYTGTNPHTDHVHFSLSWTGARGETSFFEWLRGELREKPASSSGWVNLFALLVGSASGYFAARWLARRLA